MVFTFVSKRCFSDYVTQNKVISVAKIHVETSIIDKSRFATNNGCVLSNSTLEFVDLEKGVIS